MANYKVKIKLNSGAQGVYGIANGDIKPESVPSAYTDGEYRLLRTILIDWIYLLSSCGIDKLEIERE